MDEGIREEDILGERHSMNKSQERGDRPVGEAAYGSTWEVGLGAKGTLKALGSFLSMCSIRRSQWVIGSQDPFFSRTSPG